MKKFLHSLRTWVFSFTLASVIGGLGFVLFYQNFSHIYVPSASMAPTIEPEDRLIVEKSQEELAHGDVVVFYPPVQRDRHIQYIKRLIGLPGDTIEVKDGQLIRNGEVVEEGYILEPMTYTFEKITIPKGKYFFLGDNRNESFDSHAWEVPFVDEGKIVGKAVMKFYPVENIEAMLGGFNK